ncbi:MAG: hypothetical protein V4462_09410 [Pseudomonadota bacterium]
MTPPENEDAGRDQSRQKKLRWETYKLGLDIVLATLGLVFIAAFSIGAFLLFWYFFRFNFNPGGISASDTVSLSYLLFGFVLTILFLTIFFAIAAYPVSSVFRWLLTSSQSHRKARWTLRWWGGSAGVVGNVRRQLWRDLNKFYFLTGCLFLILCATYISIAHWKARLAIGAMLFVGFLLSELATRPQSPVHPEWQWPTARERRPPRPYSLGAWLKRQSEMTQRVVVGAAMVGSSVVFLFNALEDTVLHVVGFRKHDVAVRLGKDDFNTVVERATRAGYVVNACAPLNPAFPVIEHMDVLWYGLGTRALLRYPALSLSASEIEEEAALRFELLNGALAVISGLTGTENCHEFLISSIFKHGQAVLSTGADEVLKKQLGWLKDDPPRWNVSIAVLDAGVSMDETKARALVLKAYLLRRYRLPTSSIFIETGRVDLKRDCGDLRDVVLCNKLNRRIEIRGELSL